jgi:hypothetical protein
MTLCFKATGDAAPPPPKSVSFAQSAIAFTPIFHTPSSTAIKPLNLYRRFHGCIDAAVQQT